ncbi:MAG: hypothetical protein OXH49_12880 [Gemmatimonadetes bacterium]|nr:hypothetical protein [Gemmatimonadota bacterium]
MSKLFAVAAVLVVAGCAPMEPEVVSPDPIAELMAIMGIIYEPGTGIEERIRAALGMPDDFPIGARVENGPMAVVWADASPPVCQMNATDTVEKVREFHDCWGAAIADTSCDAHFRLVMRDNGDGTMSIVGAEIWCGPPPDPMF